MKGLYSRLIANSIDPLRPEVTLKRLDDITCRLVVQTVDFHAISVEREHRLECFDRLARVAGCQKSPTTDRRWLDEMTDPVFRKYAPGKTLTWINFSPGCGVGMCEHALRRNVPSLANAT